MAISKQAKKITRKIYSAYGTDSGVVFGIRSDLRASIETIVQVVLWFVEEEKEDNEERGK